MASLISALESRVLLAASPGTVLHINAGGPALVDSLGRGFAPDSGFTGGTAVQGASYELLNTDDTALFLSYRSGADFSFSADLANGDYQLFLDFADPTSSAAGQRVFDILAEDRLVADQFDIFARAGAKNAAALSAAVSITDGKLDLAFHGELGEAIVSAIVVLPIDVPAEVRPYSWQNLTAAERNTLSLAQLKSIGYTMLLYSNDNKGRYPADLATLTYHQFNGFLHPAVADPRTDTVLPRGLLSPIEMASWAAQSNDFIYLGAGKKSNEPADSVLAYENPQRVEGHINVLLGDGHTETWDRAIAAERLGFSPDEPIDPPCFPPQVARDHAVEQSAANLKALRDAMQAYWRNNRGRVSQQLGVLYQSYGVPIEKFANPRSGTQLPPSGWTTQQKVDWINANSDYVLVAGGQSYTSAYPVLLSEKPQAFSDGINILTGDGQVDFYEMRWARELLALQTAPSIIGASLQYETSPISIDLQFSEDVSASLAAGDLLLTNLTTGQVISSDRFTLEYDWSTHMASYNYDVATWGPLPDGNYRASIAAAGVSDASAKHPAGDFALSSFILAGDANHDRRVDAADLAILAMNWNGTSKTFSQGDFNLDGTVDLRDLDILAAHYQTTLPEAQPPVRSPIRQPAKSVAAQLLLARV